eukprot:6209936-Pleurochrysis_carterae.AAC.2
MDSSPHPRIPSSCLHAAADWTLAFQGIPPSPLLHPFFLLCFQPLSALTPRASEHASQSPSPSHLHCPHCAAVHFVEEGLHSLLRWPPLRLCASGYRYDATSFWLGN